MLLLIFCDGVTMKRITKLSFSIPFNPPPPLRSSHLSQGDSLLARCFCN